MNEAPVFVPPKRNRLVMPMHTRIHYRMRTGEHKNLTLEMNVLHIYVSFPC